MIPFRFFQAVVPFAAVLALAWPGDGLNAKAWAADLPAAQDIIEGFKAVVFGSEIPGSGSSDYLRKFAGPVQFHIENLAKTDRRAAVRRFIRGLDRTIPGLDTAIAPSISEAEFVVHVVDRADYQMVGRRIYRDAEMVVPGTCIVRVNYERTGIRRADALIVSDLGEEQFERCMIEEILQGLGPLNENDAAPQSVFNDTSLLSSFTAYDRTLMLMLYDERLRPGMSEDEVEPLLPGVFETAWRRVHGK